MARKNSPIVGDPGKTISGQMDRPEHNDFATTSELRDREYSGLRYNALTEEVEIWLVGTVAKVIKAPGCRPDPEVLDAAYIEVFGVSIRDMDIGVD